jgi:hypothetical protein
MGRGRADVDANTGKMRVGADQAFMVVTVIPVTVVLMAKHGKWDGVWSLGILGLEIRLL